MESFEHDMDLMMVEGYQVKTIVERIKLENNVGDIFRLPCVSYICKTNDGKSFKIFATSPSNQLVDIIAHEGDTLIHYDDDTWDVMRAIKEEEQNG